MKWEGRHDDDDGVRWLETVCIREKADYGETDNRTADKELTSQGIKEKMATQMMEKVNKLKKGRMKQGLSRANGGEVKWGIKQAKDQADEGAGRQSTKLLNRTENKLMIE